MIQITQKDLIKLIEEKKDNAKNRFFSITFTEKTFGEASLLKSNCLGKADAYEDLICYLKDVEIVSEHNNEDKELLEPLCNKCNKTNETCSFHRIGSAYEDCSGFEEKPNEVNIKQDMKVKIFYKRYYCDLEGTINDFIKDKNIIDIKFSTESNIGYEYFYAMVIYKADKSE